MAIYKLTELYDVSSGLNISTDKFGFGQPFLSFKDVFNNYETPTTLNELVDVTPAEVDRFSVKYGDVLLTRTSETIGELGMSCICINEIPNAVFNGFCKRLRPNTRCVELCLPKYMKYAFRTKRFRQLISSYSNLSTRASLNEGIIGKLDIEVPTIEEQEIIIDIIKPIEEVIEIISKQKECLKALLIMQYKSCDENMGYLVDYIKLHTNPYSNQLEYLATNAVSELSYDSEKVQILSTDYKPSRANLTPCKDSILLSKLDGENKVLYVGDNFPCVVSTGFFNITTDYVDHIVGFFLSEDFKKQKTVFSTGTTMVGLNNETLSKIRMIKPNSKNSIYTLQFNKLLQLEHELNKILKYLLNLLVK